MRVAVALLAAGIALIVWLRHTRHTFIRDRPAWKPDDHTIYDNRGDRR